MTNRRMRRWSRTWLGASSAMALAGVAALPSCIAPYDDRAAIDETVGQGTVGGVTFQVVHGLATLRAAEEGELVLWGGAPAFDIDVESAEGATTSWIIEVQNALADAELRSRSGPAVRIEPLSSDRTTVKRYRVELPPGERRELAFGPLDADEDAPFRVGVLSDVQEAIDEVQDVFAVLNAASIRFVMGAGDLTVTGAEDELQRFQQEMRTLEVPYFTTIGNHELVDGSYAWPDYFGRANFRFDYRNVRFSFVDSGSATVDPKVYGWLETWLGQAEDRVHIVSMHIPPVDPIGVRNGSFGSRNEAAKLLSRLAQGRVDLTIYGHIHSHYEFENAGIPARISGGGGALPEKLDGVGRHVLIVEIDPQQGIGPIEVREVD